MRYFLLCLAAFVLLAVPAFAGGTLGPTDVTVNVHVPKLCQFELTGLGGWDITPVLTCDGFTFAAGYDINWQTWANHAIKLNFVWGTAFNGSAYFTMGLPADIPAATGNHSGIATLTVAPIGNWWDTPQAVYTGIVTVTQIDG